ncbi:MAG: HAMP domain-containing sensor histidine kinase [Pseudomonadota bacterium]
MHQPPNSLPERLVAALSRRLDAAVHGSVEEASNLRTLHKSFMGAYLVLAILPVAALPFVASLVTDFSLLHLLAIVSFALFVIPARTLSNSGSLVRSFRWAFLATLLSTAIATTAFPASWLTGLIAIMVLGGACVMIDRPTWVLGVLAAIAYAGWAHFAFLGRPEITEFGLALAFASAVLGAVCARGVARAASNGAANTETQSLISTLEMDRSSRVLDCHGAFCAELQIGVSDRPLIHRVNVADRIALLAGLDRAASNGTQEQLECRLQTSLNVWQPVRLTLMANARGTIDATIVCDAELAELRDQVQKLQTELEAANGSKTRFIATMSHELRTPLNAILGFSDLLRQSVAGPVSERQLEYLNDIHGAGEHLLAIVNDILDASKIDAGYYQLACDEFEVGPVLSGACSLAEASGNGSGVRIEADIQPGLDTIFADKKAFKQIAINLLSNAVKFSHAGGEVRLGLERKHRGVLLTVRDFGVGMSEADLATACMPFVQADDRHSRHAEGTGLGLAIVKGFVELHGGRLDLASRLGHGTTVRVLLPNMEPEVVVPINADAVKAPPIETQIPEPSDQSNARANMIAATA